MISGVKASSRYSLGGDEPSSNDHYHYIYTYIYKIDLEVESSTNKFNPQKMPLNLAVLEVTTMWGPLVRYMLVNKSPNNYSYKYPLVI